MSNDVLVKVDHVQKKFCRSLKRSMWYGVQDICSDLNPFGSKLDSSLHMPGSSDGGAALSEICNDSHLRYGEFWAVNDTSFEVRRGECLGLIGHNGAGKTTLLKMLSGLIKPDRGRIELRGRVGGLIALGAGFNPILTGRENIYVNATILGLKKKEIDREIAGIIDFADIGDFLDTPVQSYSSGMQVRLGFAIATAIKPEILLLDEVLAVGDIAFRIKCYNRIGSLQKSAATILVTHDMSYLSTVCNRILFMSRGKGTYFSDRNAGIQRYIDTQTPASAVPDAKPLLTFIPPLKFASVTLGSEKIEHGEDLSIFLKVESCANLYSLQLRCTAFTEHGSPLLAWDSDWSRQLINIVEGLQSIRIVFGPVLLTGGRYRLTLSLMSPGNGELLLYSHNNLSFEITSKEIYGEIKTTFALKQLDFHRDGDLSRLFGLSN